MNAPHIHAYGTETITFSVIDPGSGKGITGLSPVLSIRRLGEDSASEVTMQSGELEDAGNGDYNWTRKFPGAGFYALLFSVQVEDGIKSHAFPLELTKAGGERIFTPSEENAVYNYQIRWSANPHVPHMGDKTTFDIELKRTVGEVNLEEPWTNRFEHLRPANLKQDSLAVLLESADGTPVKELTSTVEYRGLGVYRATMEFPAPTHMMKETVTYRLRVRFTDDAGYTIDESDDDYLVEVRKPGSGGSAPDGGSSGEPLAKDFAVDLLFGGGQAKTGINNLIVRIMDKAGNPVEAAGVGLTAAMEDTGGMDSHNMSSLKPITLNLDERSGNRGGGEYRAQIRLPYKGPWNIAVEFSAEGQENRAAHRIEVAGSGGPSGAVVGGLLGLIALILVVGAVRRLFAPWKIPA